MWCLRAVRESVTDPSPARAQLLAQTTAEVFTQYVGELESSEDPARSPIRAAIVDDASLTVEKLHASLTALSPQSTLDRGYAVVQNADGHVIDDAGKVSAGDHLTLTLRKGVITATAQ